MKWILLVILLLPNSDPIVIREYFPGGRACKEAAKELLINDEELNKRKGNLIVECLPSGEAIQVRSQ